MEERVAFPDNTYYAACCMLVVISDFKSHTCCSLFWFNSGGFEPGFKGMEVSVNLFSGGVSKAAILVVDTDGGDEFAGKDGKGIALGRDGCKLAFKLAGEVGPNNGRHIIVVLVCVVFYRIRPWCWCYCWCWSVAHGLFVVFGVLLMVLKSMIPPIPPDPPQS